jgi:myo-inositol-1(or 4)-monophosphatase
MKNSKHLDPLFIKEVMSFVRDLGYEAGEILMKYQKNRHQLTIQDKGREGIASDADKASENLILSEIKSKYPDHFILSEEDYAECKDKSFKVAQESEFCWVIDPLDGTNNYVNGIPIYAVSICLMYHGEPVVGLVYNPLSGESFLAGLGMGSYLTDFRINPLKKNHLLNEVNDKEMKECIFSPAPVYHSGTRFEVQLSTFKKNITGARAVRRLGSAALEICYVASGNFDAYWEQDLKPWDVAAALLVCSEAGVLVTDYNGQPFNPFLDSVIAASTPLHSKILGKISP